MSGTYCTPISDLVLTWPWLSLSTIIRDWRQGRDGGTGRRELPLHSSKQRGFQVVGPNPGCCHTPKSLSPNALPLVAKMVGASHISIGKGQYNSKGCRCTSL